MALVRVSLISICLLLINDFSAALESIRTSSCQYDSTLTKVNCSGMGLKKFPNFTDDLVYIDVSYNFIRNVRDIGLIPSGVKHLDLSHNSIQFIESGVITGLRNLQYLDLSHNRELNFDVLSNISSELQFTSIKILKLNSIHCEIGMGTLMRYRHFKYFRNTSLEELEMSSNRIEVIETNVINSIPKSIQRLELSNNRFIFGFFWLEFIHLTNLKYVNLSYMSSVYGPSTYIHHPCSDKKTRCASTANYENHYVETYKGNILNTARLRGSRQSNVTIYFQKSLEELDVSNCFIHFDINLMNIFFEIPNLKKFYSNGNFLLVMNGTSSISYKTIYADLSNNYCSYIGPSYFARGKSLEKLKLSKNYIGYILERDYSPNIFRHLGSLKYLDLSQNFILNLPYNLFSPLKQIEWLDLSRNNFYSLSLPLNELRKLTSLDLSNNRIRFFSGRMMKDLDEMCESHPMVINLSGNLLQCSCETITFLQWMDGHSRRPCIVFPEFSSYRCTYTNLTEISFKHVNKIIDDLILHCSSDVGIIVGSVSVITIFVLALSTAILYRYRWKIRYLYYTTKRAFTIVKPGERHDYKYHVFLSYADEDKQFAVSKLMQKLEENVGTRICCHSRDFTPGRPIADNIAAAVHESRFTVCVISKFYLKSYWCMYEFNLAEMEMEYARGGENNIILLLMSDFNAEGLPLNLLNHINKDCYLEVPPLANGELSVQFLQRLKLSIGQC